jgi:hypothetical protein
MPLILRTAIDLRNKTVLHFTVFILAAAALAVHAQQPQPVRPVTFFHNWNDQNAPYKPLNQIDSRYNTVMIAFALPEPGTTYKMAFGLK